MANQSQLLLSSHQQLLFTKIFGFRSPPRGKVRRGHLGHALGLCIICRVSALDLMSSLICHTCTCTRYILQHVEVSPVPTPRDLDPTSSCRCVYTSATHPPRDHPDLSSSSYNTGATVCTFNVQLTLCAQVILAGLDSTPRSDKSLKSSSSCLTFPRSCAGDSIEHAAETAWSSVMSSYLYRPALT